VRFVAEAPPLVYVETKFVVDLEAPHDRLHRSTTALLACDDVIDEDVDLVELLEAAQ